MIQAIDKQLSKQDDLQKKKVCSSWSCFCLFIILCSHIVYNNKSQSIIHFFFIIHQVCVLRLIQVVRSVEKIEKILHSQNPKESSSLEVSRYDA